MNITSSSPFKYGTFGVQNLSFSSKKENLTLSSLCKDSFSFNSNLERHVIPNDEKTKKEIKISEHARKEGVTTPKIVNGMYYTKGTKANIKTSPIQNKHLEDILKNILIMDIAEIYHGDLEKEHVFYLKDGTVEVDCFRFGEVKSFDEKAFADRLAWQFPNEYGLANLIDYENYCLGDYLEQIKNNNQKLDFVQNYLKISSHFHSKKAFNLIHAKADKKLIQFEELQARLYKNPDKNIVELIKDRIEFKYLERKAFTDWDEGGGACNHEINNNTAIKGLFKYYDAWVECIKYQEKLENIKKKTKNKDKLELLNYMELYSNHWQKNYNNMIRGMSECSVNPKYEKNILFRNIPKEDRDKFLEKFDKISSIENRKDKIKAIKRVKADYKQLLKKNKSNL